MLFLSALLLVSVVVAAIGTGEGLIVIDTADVGDRLLESVKIGINVTVGAVGDSEEGRGEGKSG